MARLPSSVIASIKLFTSPDPDGYLFAVMSSAMFLTWQKTVGGRLKSDPSFTNTIVWNTLPLPMVSPATRGAIITAGRRVLAARELRPNASLAEQYDPARMAPELMEAHSLLDEAVDRAFGATSGCRSDLERQELLFTRYAELAASP